LTNDIPNVSEEATKDLDENGIIRIGANVARRRYLIGKITPKGETIQLLKKNYYELYLEIKQVM
jgi:DNA-directed RNA polymerase beta subunit